MTVHIRFERVSGWARTPARLPDHERSPVLNVDLSIRDLDGRAVVALRGELGLADAPSVASHLIAAVAACGPWVIVDLADLEGIGYSGLSVLLRVRKWTRRSGGDLSLAAPQQPVRRILEISGLIEVFSVYPSVEEAASRAGHAQPRSPAVPQRAGWLPGLFRYDADAVLLADLEAFLVG